MFAHCLGGARVRRAYLYVNKIFFADRDLPSIFRGLPHQAREEFVARPERVFYRPQHNAFGGALF